MPSDEEAAADTPQRSWPWPDLLDALVAAPGNHSVLFENDRVRVVRTRILPGHTVPVHTHQWPGVLFILSWSDIVRRDHLGNVTLDIRKISQPPALDTPLWQEPLPPHSVENAGGEELNAVQVEIKGAP